MKEHKISLCLPIFEAKKRTKEVKRKIYRKRRKSMLGMSSVKEEVSKG